MQPPPKTDLVIAGGGLAGGLIALALAARRPDLAVTLVEQDERLGGNHIWSFFDGDIDAANRALTAPLVCHRWQGYDVAFPTLRRTLAATYNSIESERFDAVVRAALPPDRVMTGVAIAALDRAGATLADGTRIAAAGVIDARGFADRSALTLGWQKFAGLLLRLARPHGLIRPVLMDATVDQAEGYRFVYLLPFDEHRIFVEDTYYSLAPGFDADLLARRVHDYAAARGWEVSGVERREAASLPIAMGGDFEAYWRGGGDLPRVGMAAALFHPMTGYSLPDAVRTAALIAAMPDLSSAALARTLHDHAAGLWRARSFYRLLARLLFRGAPAPERRYRMLQRFYGLGEGLVERLYAARSTPLDKARILCGKPPVPFFRAVRIVMAGEV